MSAAWWLWGALLLAFADVAAADDPLDGVMRSLAARHHGEADFVEQQFLALLKRPVESSGRLVYDAPDRLEKNTLEPRPESLIVSGDRLTIRRGHQSHVLDLTAYPQLSPFIDSVRATLAGDRPRLERLYRLEFSGEPRRWSLGLTPADAELRKLVASIRIDGAADQLLRVEIRQADGDRSVTTLRPHTSP